MPSANLEATRELFNHSDWSYAGVKQSGCCYCWVALYSSTIQQRLAGSAFISESYTRRNVGNGHMVYQADLT